MKKTRKLLFSIIIVLAVIISIITVSFAISVITGVRGGISVSTIENTVTHDFTSSAGSLNLSFNKAGDKRTISIETSNRIDSFVHTSYEISIKSGSDENLTKAILVYFNGEYVDTLNNVITIDDEYSFVSLSGQRTDTITFELHQAADSSVFDSKTVSIDVTAYSETVDYSRFIYVSSSSEFKKAVDDINTGLLTDVSIVLCNSIVLSDSDDIVIKEPVKVYLDGMTLSGSLSIDDDELDPNALLILSNDGLFNASVTLGEYDTEAAKELVIESTKENLSKPVPAGTSDKAVVGNYKFYGIQVTPDSTASYNKSTDELTVLSTTNATYSSVETIVVGGEKIEYKVIGSKAALLDNILSHMPSEVVVRRDVYLPTFIPSENATIVWTSENPDIMNNEGVIISKFAEREPVTLDAEIKVNDEIYTLSYSFLVSAHNNEINFYKLVQYISPLIIKQSDADYFLPVVGGDNDYRSHYNIFNLTDSDPDFELYEWESYKEIFLTSLTYSLTDSQREDYDFITITGDNAVSLNRSTFATYAKITVTGTFDNGESHSTTVNVSIAIGSDTQLMEKAFNKVDEEISKVNVLGNILKTRKEDGFLLEKGDFSLDDSFESGVGDKYKLVYTSSNDAITVTYDSLNHKYDFKVNPEHFSEYEASIPISCKVIYERESGNIENSRVFYINLPAALHRKDFATSSIFNSIKYQVFNSLPSIEKAGTTGFNVSGSLLTNETSDYILIRDIVGDDLYVSNYATSDEYLEVGEITVNANGTTSLNLSVNPTNNASVTDKDEYTLALLINWALDDSGTRKPLSSITSDSSLSSYLSIKSNGKSFISENEMEVIETFYKAKANSSSWDDVFDEVFNVAPGMIYDTSAILVETFNAIKSQMALSGLSWYENTTKVDFGVVYAKYIEILNRYATTTSANEQSHAPAKDIYDKRFFWSKTTPGSYNLTITDHNGDTWYRTVVGGNVDVGYEKAPYLNDKTKYITEYELIVLKVFWLSAFESATTSTVASTAFNQENLDAIQNVLNNNPDAYMGYSISDFDTFGEAIINAFDASLSLPTYFKEDGIKKLIIAFDDNYNDEGYKFRPFDGSDDTVFVSALNGNAPYVTNLDALESSLSYFYKLTSLTIDGASSLNAFLSNFGLTKAFARIANSNTEITTLEMVNVAPSYLDFDISNIKLLKNLRTINLSSNAGLSNINPLINSNRSNYTQVNIRNIGEQFKYLEFTIDNLASSTCLVLYTDSEGLSKTTNSSKSSYLSSLSDIDDFVSEYMYLTNVIYSDDGSANQICWRIEKGNDIYKTEILAGEVHESIENAKAMNMYVSPYYYANTSFTYKGKNFVQGNVYKLIVNNDNLVVTQVLEDKTITLSGSFKSTYTDDELASVATPHSDNKIDNETITDKSTYISDTTIFAQTIVGDEETYTIKYNYTTFRLNATNKIGYANINPKYVITNHVYYLSIDGGSISYTEDQNSDNTKFVILTEKEAKFVKEMINGGYVMSNSKIQDYINDGTITVVGSEITIGLSSAISTNSVYIYCPSEAKFLSKPGTSENPQTLYDIETDNTKSCMYLKVRGTKFYLNGTKTTTYGERTSTDKNSYFKSRFTIRFYTEKGNTPLTTEGNNKDYNDGRWLYEFDTIEDSNPFKSRTNTPITEISKNDETQENYNLIFNYYRFRTVDVSKKMNYYLTDTGSYIADFTTSSNNNLDQYFVLMTEEDCLRLEEWYRNPTNNAVFGRAYNGSASNSVIASDGTPYYIYNIYTQNYIQLDDPNNVGAYFITIPDYRQATKLYVNGENIYYFLPDGVTRVFCNAWTGQSSTKIAGWDGNGNGSKFYADSLLTYNKTETFDKPKETTQYTTYSFGYTVYRYVGNINKYDKSLTFNENGTYYLTNDIDVEIKNEHSDITTTKTLKAGSIVQLEYDAYYAESYLADLVYYVTEFWYVNDGIKTTIPINSGDVSFTYYYDDNGVTRSFSTDITFNEHPLYPQYDSGFSYNVLNSSPVTVNYGETSVTESDTNYEAQWFTSCSAEILESHVKTTNDYSIDTYVSAYDNESIIICLSGGLDEVTDSLDSSNNNSIDFVTNGGYYLNKKANNQLEWIYSGYTAVEVNENQTMDYFLNTANEHFADSDYSVYYGTYYGYAGPTETTKLGNHYEHMHIYRLMPNSSNTAFEWVMLDEFKEAIGVDIMSDTATGAASVGDIYYCTKNGYSGFIPKDYFYKIEYDSFTDTLNMVHFNDIDFLLNSGNLSKIKNEKIQYISSNEYIGYAGTFEIEISACIRNIGGEDIVKTYKLKFVGTVIN